MKWGCSFILIFWAVSTFVYKSLLAGSSLQDNWWVPVLLGLSGALVLAQIWSIIIELKKFKASKAAPGTWRDGALVGVSGVIQPLNQPLESPISGRQAVIIEYAVKRVTRTDDSTNSVADYRGFLMTPCAVQTNRGSVAIQGFPLLTKFYEENFNEAENYLRLAKYLHKAELKDIPTNPLKALSEFTAVLSDEDGDVRMDFASKSAAIRPGDSLFDLDDDDDNDGGDDDGGKNEIPAEAVPVAPVDEEMLVKSFAEQMSNVGYSLTEQLVPAYEKVTVFGTYKANKQSIDVGGGISNLSHTIEPGEMAEVMKKTMIKSVVFFLVWTGICVAGHAAAFPELKSYLKDLVEQATKS